MDEKQLMDKAERRVAGIHYQTLSFDTLNNFVRIRNEHFF